MNGSPPPTNHPAPRTGSSLVGQTLDRYSIVGTLGEGGFGEVYRARHAVVDHEVALKVLREDLVEDQSSLARFLNEAKVVSALDSPHIVRVLDAGVTDDRRPFIAMELLQGETLRDYMKRTGPLPPEDALEITRQILLGLVAAHEAGVVHRDLKPANVFLVPGADGRPIAKLLDFGISKIQGPGTPLSSLTQTGMVMGTPQYMAPEQFQGSKNADGRSDLYATATMLYEMLSGRLPYVAATYEQLVLRIHSEPPTPLGRLVSSLHPDVVVLAERGLARDPDARFGSARQMLEAIASVGSGALAASASRGMTAVEQTPHPVSPVGPTALSPATPGHSVPIAQTSHAPATPSGYATPGSAAIAAPAPISTPAVTKAASNGGSRWALLGLVAFGLVVFGVVGGGGLVYFLVLRAPEPVIAEPNVQPAVPVTPVDPSTAPGGPVTAPPPSAFPDEATPPSVGGPNQATPPIAGTPVEVGTPSAPVPSDGVLPSVTARPLSQTMSRVDALQTFYPARQELARCRQPDDDYYVTISVVVAPGGNVMTSTPHLPDDDNAAGRCVAHILGGYSMSGSSTGIVFIEVHLPRR